MQLRHKETARPLSITDPALNRLTYALLSAFEGVEAIAIWIIPLAAGRKAVPSIPRGSLVPGAVGIAQFCHGLGDFSRAFGPRTSM